MRCSARNAHCPRCLQPSTRIHSRYTRQVADLPWHGVSVRLQLHTRRFRCLTETCSQSIFCERLPQVVSHYARKTVRLNDALRLIAFLIGGEAGARAAAHLGMKSSPDALLRRARSTSLSPHCVPRVIGVDDFAFRKRKCYGTILVDLERHRVIDLLPDREAETLQRWLEAHPTVEVVTRDRWWAYSRGTSDGAPQARQVTDRWHLLRNLRETLERVLLRTARELGPQAAPVIVTKEAVKSSYDEHSRSRLSPHLQKARLRDRTYRPQPGVRWPSAPQASWWLFKSEELKAQEQEIIDELCRRSPQIKRAQELAHSFIEMVRGRRLEKLHGWLTDAFESKMPEFATFGNGIIRDMEAVRAALSCEWSQGQVEGQVNRLKMIKRQMYGRAKFDLLRAKVMWAG
ncbi:MAG: ISL3 family transposase [Pyrinomonadaceae bacterium]